MCFGIKLNKIKLSFFFGLKTKIIYLSLKNKFGLLEFIYFNSKLINVILLRGGFENEC